MANLNGDQNGSKTGLAPQIILLLLIIAVVILAILTFTRPISQQAQIQTGTPCPTLLALMTEQSTLFVNLTSTPTIPLGPPTPEDIGYTDGIIFWSTILVLIMLVGVLINTFRQKSS
jgi:hypothetical protein